MQNKYTLLTALSRIQARKAGMTTADVEDCASEFVVKILAEHSDVFTRLPFSQLRAWLNECAHNHALNYLRALHRRRQHETLWPQSQNDSEDWETWDCPAPVSYPDTELGREIFWKTLSDIVSQLPTLQKEMFFRHYFVGETIPEIANAMNRKPHAVSQTLLRARLHVHELLIKSGITPEHLLQLLPPPRNYRSSDNSSAFTKKFYEIAH